MNGVFGWAGIVLAVAAQFMGAGSARAVVVGLAAALLIYALATFGRD